MTPRQRRVALVAGALAALGLAAALVLNALRANLEFFYTPSEVAAQTVPRDAAFRIGGLVEQGSLQRAPDGLSMRFVVTDLAQRVPVAYTGLLPDLFREGKGVVVAGRLQPDGSFRATEVLAKHDENYMPPPAAEALDRARAAKTADPLADPLAGRAARLAAGLRCLICQNQTLADSDAPLAVDMRRLIREQLAAGRSDAEVQAFFEQRYGAYVRYEPPWQPSTWLLWLGPFVLLAIGGLALWRSTARPSGAG